MSEQTLSDAELGALVRRVFSPQPSDRALALLVDLPDETLADNPAWRGRRELAARWLESLRRSEPELSLAASLYVYRNVQRANADLPAVCGRHGAGPLPADAEAAERGTAEPFDRILQSHDILVALTELSATAPLKLAARRFGFRAATMPGFSPAMIPALRLDYVEIARRVELLTSLLDRASSATLEFRVEGGGSYQLGLDLRHRSAHASTGLLRERGSVGNLPSGEAYIVPYEGELPDDPSGSTGELPVELDGEVVVYRITENRARSVAAGGAVAKREAELLAAEPAYGNLAELGLGVLGGFGVEPTGETLLDEKLGLHVAFGRSDHFGGQVGAKHFSRAEAVVHIDRVYVPAVQPRVRLGRARLELDDGSAVELLRDDRWVVDFSSDREGG
jgi:leucyl aminopeptidase (aminopeptidase T)